MKKATTSFPEEVPDASQEGGKRVTAQRRKFLLDQLSLHRRLLVGYREQKVTFAIEAGRNIKPIKEFSGTAYPSLLEDIRVFNELRLPIRLIDGPKSGYKVMLDISATYSDTAEYREYFRLKEKAAIATVAFGLICGIPSMNNSQVERMKSLVKGLEEKVLPEEDAGEDWYNYYRYHRWKRDLEDSDRLNGYLNSLIESPDGEEMSLVPNQAPPTTSQIRNALFAINRGAMEVKVKEVYWKLERYWREMHRSAAIDAGTTNDALCRKLSNLRLPMTMGCLSRLTVCTNSRKIFEKLGVADVLLKTVITGGEQLGRSEAIAGQMAESFLKSNSLLRFGIAVLGVGSIDLKNMVAYVDDAMIANMKACFLEKSSLRVLVADTGKLKHMSSSAHYPFAAIDPEYIDLIIVNEPLPESELESKNEQALNEHKTEVNSFRQNIEALKDRVPVLIAKYGKGLDRSLSWPEDFGLA